MAEVNYYWSDVKRQEVHEFRASATCPECGGSIAIENTDDFTCSCGREFRVSLKVQSCRPEHHAEHRPGLRRKVWVVPERRNAEGGPTIQLLLQRSRYRYKCPGEGCPNWIGYSETHAAGGGLHYCLDCVTDEKPEEA